MNEIKYTLIIICILLAGNLGFYVGTQQKNKFMPVKLDESDRPDTVLVFDTNTGELTGRYWKYGRYEGEPVKY
jgi:hypothetical protein